MKIRRRSFLSLLAAAMIVPAEIIRVPRPLSPVFVRRECWWTGEVSTEWEDPRNWIGGNVPDDGDDVVVAHPRTCLMPAGISLNALTMYTGVLLMAPAPDDAPAGWIECVTVYGGQVGELPPGGWSDGTP